MNRRPVLSGLVLSVLAANLAVFALTGAKLFQRRARQVEMARQTTQNLARTLALNVSALFDKIDLGLFSAATEAERQLAAGGADGPRLNTYLARQLGQIKDFEGLWVADAQGDVHWGTTLPAGQPINVRDRDYFQRLRDDPASGLVLSGPVMGRITYAWSVLAARRVNRPDGTFAGVAMGSLRVVDYFSGLFTGFENGSQGEIQLRDGELGLLAGYGRAGNRQEAPGSIPAPAPALAAIRAHPDRGSFQGVSVEDALERLTSYQKVGARPLYVFVSQSPGDYLAPWRKDVAQTLSLVAVFSLLTLLFARIGHRKSVEKALAYEKALLEAIFNAIPDALVYADLDRRILSVNPGLTALLGYTTEDLRGLSSSLLYAAPEDWADQGRRHFHAEGPVGVLPDTVAFRAKDGREVPGEITGGVVRNADGVATGFVAAIRDISERLQAEAKQARLQGELNHLHRMESIGRLAGGVAHDMNNVLAAIMAVAEVLRIQGPENRKLIDMILDALHRGRNLVKGLMAFARKDMEETGYFDLNTLVQKEAELLSTTMLQRIQLELKLAAKLPRIFGSSSALATALMNLCVNAMDAMPGGGTLTLRTRRVDDLTVELTVQDTGQGMPPEVIARAFEPFYTTKPVGKGTGLGLAMVFGTVQAHGGSVAIQSEVGKGTEVRVTLPVLAGDDPEVLQAPAAPAAQSGASLRLLLVDDDALVREAAAGLLASLGHQVTSAGGGYEALGMLEYGAGWDVVVLDLNMPGLDGLGTLVRLRPLAPGLPVLVATGYVDETVREALEALGPVVILPKPYSREEVQRALARCF